MSSSDPPTPPPATRSCGSGSSVFSSIGKLSALRQPPVAATQKVFLSYRRADTAGFAGRLFDRLADRFGKDGLFMDVDAIGVGADFVDAIENAVASCQVVLVLIGPRWLELADHEGQRRIDDPEDFVRLEVQAGLQFGRPVIPVLVDGARMPGFEDLPEPLHGLARRNALELSASRWDYDVAKLLEAIADLGVGPVRGADRGAKGKAGWIAAAAVALLALGGGWWWTTQRGEAPVVGSRVVKDAGPLVAPDEPIQLRSSVAVAGLVTSDEGEATEWLGTAIAEMIETGLALGDDEVSLRTVGGDQVVETRKSLGLPPEGELLNEDLVRLARALGVDWMIDGSFELSGGDLVKVELDLRRGGDGTTASSGRATGTSTQLFDVVQRALQKPAQEQFGLEIGNEARLVLQASLPVDPRAAQLYSEGLEALRAWDAPTARDRFERAIKIEPDHPMPHSGLAQAWEKLGYLKKAEEEAGRAVELGEELPEPTQLLLDAQRAEFAQDWPSAIRRYGELFHRYPDDASLGRRLAGARISGGNPVGALKALEPLRQLPTSDPGVELVVARAAFLAGEFHAAKEAAEVAIREGEDLDSDMVVARGLVLCAMALQEQGAFADADAALDRAQVIYEGAGDKPGLALTLESKAFKAMLLRDYETAERLFRRSIEVWTDLDYRLKVAGDVVNLGKISREKSEFGAAREYFEDALLLAADLNAGLLQGRLSNELATLAFLEGNLTEAGERYRDALEQFSSLGERRGVGLVLTNLAELAYLGARVSEAEAQHQEALATYEEVGDEIGIAYTEHQLGLVAWERGEATVARERFSGARESFATLGDPVSEAQASVGVALIDLARGERVAAVEAARDARELFLDRGLDDLSAPALSVLVRAALLTGDFDEAARLLGEFRQLADQSHDPLVEYQAAETAAEVALAKANGGRDTGVVDLLRSLHSEADRRGHVLSGLWLELLRREVEAGEGDDSDAREAVQELMEVARDQGLERLAARASRFLES